MSALTNTVGQLENQNDKQLERDQEEFLRLSKQVADFGKSIGVKIIPFRDPSLPHFSVTSELQRSQALENLRVYVEICSETIQEGKSLRDTAQLTWFALRKLGYRPTSDLFSKMTDAQIVEIHTSSFQQIFRNFRFYDYCSYSLEELYSYQLNELYHRDEKSMAYLMTYLQDLYSGKVTSAIEYGGPPHIISETQSAFKFQIYDEIATIAPLYSIGSSGGPVATITLENAKLVVQPNLDGPTEEKLLQLNT